VQDVTEEVTVKIAEHAHHFTGLNKLVLAGGVALNCVANGRILREVLFDDMWIPPAAEDAGGALGVALAVWHRYVEKPRVSPEALGTWAPAMMPREDVGKTLRRSAPGMRVRTSAPHFTNEEIETYLSSRNARTSGTTRCAGGRRGGWRKEFALD